MQRRGLKKGALVPPRPLAFLTSERSPAAVDLGLRHGARLNQAFDATVGELIAVTAHAVFETAGLESPLAAKAAVVLGALALAGGMRGARGENRDQGQDHQQHTIIFHSYLPMHCHFAIQAQWARRGRARAA